MAQRNDDDVVHLLSVAGDRASTYRTFEKPTHASGAPLIDAVLAETPDRSAKAHLRVAGAVARPAETPSRWRTHQPPRSMSQPQPEPPANVSGVDRAASRRRSLADLRRVLGVPTEASPANAGELRSLFLRLAR